MAGHMAFDTCHVSDTWLENRHVSRLCKVRGSESGGNQFGKGKEREKGKREKRERRERRRKEERRKGEEGDGRFLPLIYGVPIVRIHWTKE